MRGGWHRFCMIKYENLLCIVDYYSKFLVIKKVDSLSDKDLIQAAKVVFDEFDLPKNDFRYRHEFCL